MAARLLGPAGRGELAAIQTWAGFLGVIGTLGLPEAVVLFCSRDPSRGGQYLSTAIAAGLVGCIPMLLVGYTAMPLLLSAQRPEIIHAARWYLSIAIVYVAMGAPWGALRAQADLTRWNAVRLTLPVLWVTILGCAFIYGRATPGILALVNLIAFGAIAFPITLWVARRTIRGSYRPDFRLVLPMLRFGIPSVASGVPQILNLRFDQMLIAALLPARALGLYVVAVAWSSLLLPITQGIGAVLFPHVASQSSTQEKARAFAGVLGLATPLACVLAMVVAVATPWALPLTFGLPYEGSISSALILVAASAILSINNLLEEGFRGLNKPLFILWSELGGLFVTLVSLGLLLGKIGIVGAAISSLLGYSSVCAILLIVARNETGYSILELLLPSSSDISAHWIRVSQQLGCHK
jgi:antigen flippase